jgi:hypothetical protein
VHYDDLSPFEWIELLNIRREVKEKQYKTLQELDKAGKNQEAGENEVTKETSLATHRIDAINKMMKNSKMG